MGTKSELLKQRGKNQKFDLEERGQFGVTQNKITPHCRVAWTPYIFLVVSELSVSELLQVSELLVSITISPPGPQSNKLTK